MKLFKLLATIVVGTIISSSAFAASTPYYGKPKTEAAVKSTGAGSYVTVYNNTYDVFMVHADYECYPGYMCSPSSDLTLDVVGSPYSVITYPVNFPDSEVCLDIQGVFASCLNSGNVIIGPYQLGSKKPQVQITH